MPTTPIFIATAIFLFLTAGGLTLYLGIYGTHNAVEDRLNDLAVKVRLADSAFEDPDYQPEGLGKMLLQWAVRRLPTPKLDTASSEKLAQNLAHAGFHGPANLKLFQLVRLGSIATGAFLGFLLASLTEASSSLPLIYMICGGVVGSFLPSYYLGSRARKRQVKMMRELSDILDLLVVCVEAGLGIFEAIRVVGRESERQGRLLGTELTILSGEIAAGASLAQGLRALAERTGVDDVKSLAAILIQSEKLGSQMAPALRASSDSLRNKRKMRAEEAAQKSTVKMLVPLVLFVLPAMMIVIVGPALIQIIHTLSH
jgi:tight adherence protein C